MSAAAATRLWAGRLLAAVLPAALAVTCLAAPPRAGAAGAGPARDEAPYDSTRGDSVGEPALYLSWGAPWGMPGARQDLTLSCADTTRMDTLYLSIETGRDLPRLCAMFGRIHIRPAGADLLGPFWGLGEGGANRGGLLVQMDADGTFPCAQLWLYPGIGGVHLESAPDLGNLLLIYAVRPEDGAPISGRTRYCLARLLFRQRRCHLEGARQPVCIEWAEAGYSGGGPDILVRRGPARFVTINSPDGGACATHRRFPRIETWRPPGWLGPAAPARRDSVRR